MPAICAMYIIIYSIIDLAFMMFCMIPILQKKMSRLASIVSEEESTYLCSEQESVSCDNEIQSREETVISDDEAEVVDLMTRVELMKKERSVLWLREFKEWLDHASEDSVDSSRHSGVTSHLGREIYIKHKASWRQLGENSRFVSDYAQASGDESSTNVLDSDSSFLDMSTGLHAHHFDQIGSLGNAGFVIPVGMDRRDLKETLKDKSHEGTSSVPVQAKGFHGHTFTSQRGHRMVENLSMSALTSIDDISESRSSSACPGSPPHYQKDILHRRHNLEEEILQLSAESFSVASSDSNTSCSEEDNCESRLSIPEGHQLLNKSMEEQSSDPFRLYDMRYEVQHVRGSDGFSVGICAEKNCSMQKVSNPDHCLQSCASDVPGGAHDGEFARFVDEEVDLLARRKHKQKTKRRVVTLLEDDSMVRQAETLPKLNGNIENHVTILEDEQESRPFYGSDFDEVIYKNQILANTSNIPLIDDANGPYEAECFSSRSDEFIEDYFRKNVADLGNHEICKQCMRCYCILELDSLYRER